jgi:hypothetical protein
MPDNDFPLLVHGVIQVVEDLCQLVCKDGQRFAE